MSDDKQVEQLSRIADAIKRVESSLDWIAIWLFFLMIAGCAQ